MHTNPVKRGLVTDPKLWPWSSYRFYKYDEKNACTPDREPKQPDKIEDAPFAKPAKSAAPRTSTASTKTNRNFKPEAKGPPPALDSEGCRTRPGLGFVIERISMSSN
jgi:hypothetical protein